MSIMQLTQTIQIVPSPGNRFHKPGLQPTLPGMEPEEPVIPRITNRQIAEVLAGIADLIESQQGNPYRVQAYRNAARGVLDLPEQAMDILARGEELHIAGLGERLRGRIRELVEFGTFTFQNGLALPMLPQGVRALLSLEHVGPYTAIRLYEELGVDSAEKLYRLAQQQKIRKLPGFGARSEARLKNAAERALHGQQKPRPLGGVA
ncbi:MAG TPA: helix-hairpin-helix domain-containing protein [Ktedonobacteraceae bacterium]|jgi:DNA polymerase (family 10)|nr:helix-hairpin-helix domain-containing protein [Ktedonobacteraceae bacterium]